MRDSTLEGGPAEVTIRGETLVLLPERAAFWRAEEMLFVADPHFGKAATFRAGGIPVPSGTTTDAITRLESAVTRTRARHVTFLGDLLHAREGRSQAVFAALVEWRARNSELGVTLVRGNHDRRAGDPPGELNIYCVDAPHVMWPFVLAHHPAADTSGYVLAGHVHPGVRLYGTGGLRMRLPCFAFGRDCGVLPAFGDFTGLADADPDAGALVYAVADESVVLVTSRA